MALPTTSLSFSALQTEFGGSNPISLSEYYRGAGGGYVPSGTTSSYGTIPTFGEISLGVFRGTQKTVISISNQSLVNITYEPFPTYIRYRLNSNGKAYQVSNDIGNSTVITYLEDWVVPNSSASDYEVFATVTNGGNLQGDLNTWVPLSFTRDWILESNIVEESFTTEFTIQIRKIGTSTVLDTANISLTATYLGN